MMNENENENNFKYTRTDAAHLLRSIAGLLLPVLDSEGYQADLSTDGQQQQALLQLRQLHRDPGNWLNDSSVIQSAGISRADVSLLLAALAYGEARRMKDMHEADNG